MVRYLKGLKSSKFVRVKAFPMYGGIGVSAPSLHRESTDSLIMYYKDIMDSMYDPSYVITVIRLCVCTLHMCHIF